MSTGWGRDRVPRETVTKSVSRRDEVGHGDGGSMGRRKGSRLTEEHRARIAAGQRRRHAGVDRTPVECPVCGRKCAGQTGLAIHVGWKHSDRVGQGEPETGSLGL